MEKEREAPQKQQQERPPQTPLQCPRCGSMDTKFRYYNNNSRAQPRHYCKTCKRLWTVGGNMRNIPVGGKIKDCKTSKASSSKGGNSTSQPLHPLLPQQQNSQSKTPMPSIGSQNVDSTMFQQFSNFPSPLSQFAQVCSNDEISCLDAIQSLIQPEITNRHVYHGNHFINVNVGVNDTVPQEWNVQNMASQQTMQQEIPGNMESHQPAWPMNSLPRDTTNGLSFTTSNEGINIIEGTTNTEDPNYVNVDEWLNFPGDDAP